MLIWCAATNGRPIAFFTRDPIAAISSKDPAYAGFVSNLGIVCWCFGAAACLLSCLALYRTPSHPNWQFFAYAALLTTVLMFDDLYMIHEQVAPDHLHIPQPVAYLIYAILTLGFFVVFRAQILKTDYLLLVAACLVFFVSIASDLLLPRPINISISGKHVDVGHVVEDGTKLLGIALWSWYFFQTCLSSLRRAIGRRVVIG